MNYFCELFMKILFQNAFQSCY